MNSLNILSSRVIGQSKPRSRSHSRGRVYSGSPRSDLAASRSYSEGNIHDAERFEDESLTAAPLNGDEKLAKEESSLLTPGAPCVHEKTGLLQTTQRQGPFPPAGNLQSLAQRLFDAIAETIKAILSALASPAVYVARTFRDDDGRYSALAPVRRIRQYLPDRGGDPAAMRKGARSREPGARRGGTLSRKLRSSPSTESLSSNTSEFEADRRASRRHTRSKSISSDTSGDDATPRRSIRIKLHNDGHPKRSRRQKQESKLSSGQEMDTSLAAESLKSPISQSVHKITKYPHAPVPPRPLIPPRQPSYTAGSTGRLAQKTLVLDLDETLIHSLAKGGRMSSGHMVEVKLSTPVTTTATPGGPPVTIGPQHPILYYVHKRPHCDDFLRKVCKWYKLVIFTASVQEYADPVIDWLEQERKFFSGRYYRQHCTLRNGAYIKDLSFVEPDLSKVMILDNSPMSYIFHEDNAIPIEGWINDPTDNDLLHLIPMLEAMQYVTDVRALLSLRRGEVHV
ncbi:hypothetical protein VTO42DRAFT_6440 [Malbranchea cinnamomea]